MQALMKISRGVGNVELRDIPEPIPGSEEVKVRVKAAGICGTDIHIMNDEFPYNPPVVLGHEVAGIVEECGEKVSSFKVGDRVTSRTSVGCGKCKYCHTGRANLCPNRLTLGLSINGGFAKYFVIPESNLHLLPENVGFVAGALTEPLACCVHAVLETGKVSPGESVLITGPGPIGLICTQLAKASGGYVTIMGTPRDKERLELAKKLGADETVFTTETEELINNKREFEVVVECSGAEPAIDTGLRLATKRARYVQMGLIGKEAKINIDQIVYKEIIFLGSFAQKWTAWGKALNLLGHGIIQTEPLVSHRLSLNQWQEGFEMLINNKGLKKVIIPE